MADTKNSQGFSTRPIHAGQHPDPTTGAVMTPIYATSTYAQESPGVNKGYEYARGKNPTREAFEACIADLEGGTHGFGFGSGMAATSTALELLDAGDHIVTGTTEGIVKRISVRATEIETFRKQSIVVPNSDLINSPVGNWTHRNRVQRSEIPVSVAYGTDPEKVIAILLEIATAVPDALQNPEPHVDFLAFGASSLDFELRFCLADHSDGIRIRAEVRIAILKRFELEGIEIPYARQDIMILPRPGRSGQPAPGASDDLIQDGAGV